MWPKRAFHDQNVRPHSVHGVVILGADGLGFFGGLGRLLAGLSSSASSGLVSLERFFRCCCGALLSAMVREVEDEEASAAGVGIGLETTTFGW